MILIFIFVAIFLNVRGFRLQKRHLPKFSVFSFCSVQVFDDVITDIGCDAMANNLHSSPPKFSVFRRDLDSFNEIEALIDSVLTAMKDDSKFVEYWWRTHWVSHIFHRDIDEKMLALNSKLRYPQHGHVLYVSFDDKMIGGQTVVLDDALNCTNSAVRNLFVVPPKRGRLLRFCGRLQHGVPRPSMEYFLADQTREQLLELPALRRLDVGNIEDNDGGEQEESVARLVLLFNTWGDDPPIHGDEGDVSLSPSPEAPPCQPFSEWKEVPFEWVSGVRSNGSCDVHALTAASALLSMRIGLPEDRRRRDSYDKSLVLHSDADGPAAFALGGGDKDRTPKALRVHVISRDNDDDD